MASAAASFFVIAERNKQVSNLLYRNYGSEQPCASLDEFVRERVSMVAPLLGGANDVALQYTWAVSDDGEIFRNPTPEESKDFYEAVWDFRASGLDCSRGCELRARFDGIWRCMTCTAVWTGPEGGHSYGVPMTPGAVRGRITELREQSEEAYVRYSTSFRMDLTDIERTADDYATRIAAGRQDKLIMDVQLLMGLYYRVLVINGEDGARTTGWERTL